MHPSEFFISWMFSPRLSGREVWDIRKTSHTLNPPDPIKKFQRRFMLEFCYTKNFIKKFQVENFSIVKNITAYSGSFIKFDWFVIHWSFAAVAALVIKPPTRSWTKLVDRCFINWAIVPGRTLQLPWINLRQKKLGAKFEAELRLFSKSKFSDKNWSCKLCFSQLLQLNFKTGLDSLLPRSFCISKSNLNYFSSW